MDAIHLPHSATFVPIPGAGFSDLDSLRSQPVNSAAHEHLEWVVERGPHMTSNNTVTASITVVIPCKNESEQLSGCIRSAAVLADEVLVADSGSTDGSIEIAQALGARVIEREFRTYGDFQNWAIPQASHSWVLVLDSDERVTPELAAEVRSLLSGEIDGDGPQHSGYLIPRRNHFLGHPIRFGPWKNDRCLRLFRREAVRYVGNTDHAHAKLRDGSVGVLRNHLLHYTCTSYEQYLPKLQRYAALQARVWYKQGRRTNALQMLFRGPFRFLQGYVARLGFLDGVAGLQVCALVAYLSYLKHARLWELQNASSRHRRQEILADWDVERFSPVDAGVIGLSAAS
jgi:glycosyltransferase involved in cell wall biosynthesis